MTTSRLPSISEAELPPLVGMRLLVVSQSLERAADRARTLEQAGYHVVTCGEPPRVLEGIEAGDPESAVVDLGRELGFPSDVVRAIRRASPLPIVAVGCAGTLAELARVLEAGADAFCRPNCPSREIDLHLRALWRRVRSVREVSSGVSGQEALRIGALEIDRGARLVRKAGALVPLSPTEYRLLLSLAERPGEVIPSKALIVRVWGSQYAEESHYLRLYIRYLRQKLEDDPSNPRYIVNRWGAGYALEGPPRAA